MISRRSRRRSITRIPRDLIQITSLSIAALLAVFATYGSIYVTMYFHEFGHALYGFLNNLLFHQTISRFEITNWVDFPPFPFLKAPQQIRIVEGSPSLNFALGGIIFVILAWSLIATLYSQKSGNRRRRWVFLVPVLFALLEILNNYFCGTDNLISGPLEVCHANPWLLFIRAILPFGLMIPFTILLLPVTRLPVLWYANVLERWKSRPRDL